MGLLLDVSAAVMLIEVLSFPDGRSAVEGLQLGRAPETMPVLAVPAEMSKVACIDAAAAEGAW